MRIISVVLTILLGLSSTAFCWNVTTVKDPMTGKIQVFAMSSAVPPQKRMGFPYQNTRAWLGVGCEGKSKSTFNDTSEWAFIGFTTVPNLRNTEIRDGYSIVRVRVKWDDTIETEALTQEWGDKFLSFLSDSYVIQKIQESNYMLLELNWFGEGMVYFKFPLKSSAKAIKEMRRKCKK